MTATEASPYPFSSVLQKRASAARMIGSSQINFVLIFPENFEGGGDAACCGFVSHGPDRSSLEKYTHHLLWSAP